MFGSLSARSTSRPIDPARTLVFDLDPQVIITGGFIMLDRTAYWIARPPTPERPPRKAVAISVALTLVLLVIGLSGTTAHPSQAATPLLAGDGKPTLDNPAAFTSMLRKVMLADASLGQAGYYAKQYPHALAWQVNYQQMVNSCLRAVAEYDGAASKYTLNAFTNQDLPRQIDITAAPTDCRSPRP